MKINHANVTGAGANAAEHTALDKTGKAGPGSSSAEARRTGGEDTIELSDLGRQLRLLAVDSPERDARIEQLRAAVSAGSYEADAVELSRRLIDDALQGN